MVYVAGNIPYNVWMVKSYIDTIPRSLDEAARIDGASHFRIWATIVMPVAKPIITFLGITTFTGPWMDFVFPKMVLRSVNKQTLALGLFSFVTDKKNDFTTFAAGSFAEHLTSYAAAFDRPISIIVDSTAIKPATEVSYSVTFESAGIQ